MFETPFDFTQLLFVLTNFTFDGGDSRWIVIGTFGTLSIEINFGFLQRTRSATQCERHSEQPTGVYLELFENAFVIVSDFSRIGGCLQ